MIFCVRVPVLSEKMYFIWNRKHTFTHILAISHFFSKNLSPLIQYIYSLTELLPLYNINRFLALLDFFHLICFHFVKTNVLDNYLKFSLKKTIHVVTEALGLRNSCEFKSPQHQEFQIQVSTHWLAHLS